VISPQPVVPAVVPRGEAQRHLFHNLPRFSYPEEVLKHKFIPYGANSTPETSPMDVDAAEAIVVEKRQAMTESKEKEKKSKKRKGDPTSQKLSKKVKTAS
jgi:hypothetical protein